MNLLEHLAKEEPETLRNEGISCLLNRLIAAGETISVVHTFGHWCDVELEQDLLLASAQVEN